jgi:hypothetical protein
MRRSVVGAGIDAAGVDCEQAHPSPERSGRAYVTGGLPRGVRWAAHDGVVVDRGLT